MPSIQYLTSAITFPAQTSSSVAEKIQLIVTLAEAKNFLRIAHDTQDDYICNLIASVTDWIERKCSISLSAKTFIEYHAGGGYYITPEHCPINSVSSVYDTLSETTLVQDDDYVVYTDRIMFAGSGRFPAINGAPRYRITYNGGYGATVALPQGLRLAILQIISRAWNNRGNSTTQSSQGESVSWDDLIQSDLWHYLRPFMQGDLL